MNVPLRHPAKPDVDIAVIGTGFSGLGMGVALLKAGRKDFVILEKAPGVGGTWQANTYPGCACDIPSHLYSFSFEQNPAWSRMYPTQPEIEAYLNGVADKYGLRPHLRLNTQVDRAEFDEAGGFWRITTGDGASFTARALVSGMGGLSRPVTPKLKGIEDFKGAAFHSAQWDHGYDFAGKRVAVIGTGASAIQFVPQIAPKAAKLTLFQRTPPWIIPKPDRPMKPWEKALFRAIPAAQNMFRRAIYCGNEARSLGLNVNPKIMLLAQRMALKHIETQIPDPALRAKLTPNYTMGCKRVLISNDYYPALARDNVELETSGVDHVTAAGVAGKDGVEHPADVIVYGTGFAATDPLGPTAIIGVGGRDLREAWARGAEAYWGLTVNGYPNLFFLMGPNTGLGHNSMVYMIESQIHYVMEALALMDRQGAVAMQPSKEAQARFNAGIQARLEKAIWAVGGCKSWYVTEDGRNTTLWPGFTFTYRNRTRKVRAGDYAMMGVRVGV